MRSKAVVKSLNEEVFPGFFDRELEELDKQGLLRSPLVFSETGGVFLKKGKRCLNFSSNDYLNLSRHPVVIESAVKAMEEWGSGSTASRLMCGTTELHRRLEEELAALMGCEDSIVFGSGFLSNLGMLTALASAGDHIFADKLNHASLIDGMRLSGARWQRYRHKDLNHLESLLAGCPGGGRRYIVTDSVFSMDGDIAPLKELAFLGEKYNAGLIVDEAHGIGVFGSHGGGVVSRLGMEPPLCLSGTLSKAIGGYGGFVACRGRVKEYLVNKARSFIYSTALPPGSIGGALGAMSVMRENPLMGETLLERVCYFHSALQELGLIVSSPESHIMTVLIGDNKKALKASEKLARSGIYAVCVRPPTVAPGTARLRLSVTLAHDESDLSYAAKQIIKVVMEEI